MTQFAKETLPISLEEEMRRSYLDYAMSVIVGRALPDARDGLKPVHRRVLFAMHELNNDWNRPYKKSARIVGDVIGKYHPHGDQSVYDTIVRLAQDFSMRHMLVDGQGNFGSVDGDNAAAMRYTESRLSKAAHNLLNDIEFDTVVFTPEVDPPRPPYKPLNPANPQLSPPPYVKGTPLYMLSFRTMDEVIQNISDAPSTATPAQGVRRTVTTTPPIPTPPPPTPPPVPAAAANAAESVSGSSDDAAFTTRDDDWTAIATAAAACADNSTAPCANGDGEGGRPRPPRRLCRPSWPRATRSNAPPPRPDPPAPTLILGWAATVAMMLAAVALLVTLL